MGFEPTLEFPLNTLSKRAPSATRPSLRRRALGRNDSARSRGIAPSKATTRAFPFFSILLVNSKKPQPERVHGQKIYEDFSGEFGVPAGEPFTGALLADAPAAAALAAAPFPVEAGKGGTFVLSTT